MNTIAKKNELIFNYSSGLLGEAKSLLASMYLYLNSSASKNARIFDSILGDELLNLEDKSPKRLKYTDCISHQQNTNAQSNSIVSPISSIVGNLEELNWKSVYKGFKEFELPIKDKDKIKLIKMDPGTSVPLHSHNGREYILVLDGSFSDEHGEYTKGDLQINDHDIKHHPSASKNKGCICLSITESGVVFYGPFASLLNLFTFIKSFFK